VASIGTWRTIKARRRGEEVSNALDNFTSIVGVQPAKFDWWRGRFRGFIVHGILTVSLNY
jgi:hypothetical protein